MSSIISKHLPKAHLNNATYKEMYQRSMIEPDLFWAEQAKKFITWEQPWQQVKNGDFLQGKVSWFKGASLNVCYNCVDRHLPQHADKIAFICEANDLDKTQQLTYAELHTAVCKLANVLKSHGIKKGDKVAIYLPMIAEAIIAMLACARIGAVHTVVFAGFSAESLKNRLLDAECKLVITADESKRANKTIPLKDLVDSIIDATSVKTVLVVKHTGKTVAWKEGRDVWYHDAVAHADTNSPCVSMQADDPLFILYTSGSTGQPKGILHTTAGYLVYVASTFYIFDYEDNDVYWCTADVGWITGHSYVVYGPLIHAATSVIFEGVPHHPDFSSYWQIIDKHKVSIFYTSPTAIRALRQQDKTWLESTNRESLRLLGSVGEPINPEVWEWFYHEVGLDQCYIVDTWWQTETGGILISPLPGATPLKAGSAAWPFFGIQPEIIDEQGHTVAAGKTGKLVITQPWPGMMQSIYGNDEKFFKNYFSDYPGKYLTGDDAYCDQDGYYWIIGRNDDIIKMAGHRIGSAEVENVILSIPAVAEAAVVGVPHEIKGEAIYAFITLKKGQQGSEELKKTINQTVRNNIGAIASIETIQWAEALPKTRSGKIMRRILRKIAQHELNDLGDTSTLTDPSVIEKLIQNR